MKQKIATRFDSEYCSFSYSANGVSAYFPEDGYRIVRLLSALKKDKN